MTNPDNTARTGPWSLERFRVATLVAVLAGAAAAAGFMVRAGRNSSSKVGLAVIGIWVVSPYLAFLIAAVLARRWSAKTRAALYSVMLLLTGLSLAIYTYDAVTPRRAQAAFVFVAVPPAAWLLMAAAVGVAAILARRKEAACV
jgi:phosphate/sulfate permease